MSAPRPFREQRPAVEGRVRGAVAALAFVALAVTGCTSTGTGTMPSAPPSSLSSSSPLHSTTVPITGSPYSLPPGPNAPGNIVPVHDPGQVTGTLTGPCHMTGTYPDQLPDQQCTPGSYDPAVTQANIHTTICVSGYTTKIRPPVSQTSAFKFNKAYPAYGLPKTAHTELDHNIPLELAGSNDAKNLWPEPDKAIPNKKDLVEGTLRSAVCSGKVTLRAAQVAIATNWTTAEGVLGLK